MSSHCSRYPGCGCDSNCGTKCHLPDGDPRLSENDRLPLEAEIYSREMDKERLEHLRERGFNPAVSKHRKYQSNRIPPKKKRKK